MIYKNLFDKTGPNFYIQCDIAVAVSFILGRTYGSIFFISMRQKKYKMVATQPTFT